MELSNNADVEHFPDEVDRVYDELVHTVDTSKAILRFIEKKIALEEEYNTQVRQLCKQQPILGHSGNAGCFSALVGMICDNACNTLSNLATLTIDAVSPLRSTILHLKTETQETYSEGKKIQHDRKKAYDSYKKSKYIYESILQEPHDKTTVMAENDYKLHISIVNNNQSTFFHEQLPKLMKQFQGLETLRATKTHEVINKFVSSLSDTTGKLTESIKTTTERMHRPALSASTDTEKYKKFCEEIALPPTDVQFSTPDGADKQDPMSPTSSLRNRFLKHGKSASAKWRNSFSALTSPSKEQKKIKRQSMPSKPAVSMFGTPLHQLLENQKKEYPKLDIPYVAYYLINHFKKIGGLKSENVFRVPGLTVEVQNIKVALEHGEFTEDLLFSSVHSTASAFTMWLRELPSPLIPFYMHSHCLGAKTTEELLKIFYGLPRAHVSLLIFLLGFIKELCKYKDETHMDADNLSMVFTPSIIRSQNSADVLTNIEKERQFVRSIIDAVDILTETFPVKLSIEREQPPKCETLNH